MEIDPFKEKTNRIGKLIDESGKTLMTISQETNINYDTLSAYKRQIRTPKKNNAERLAAYFDVSVAYLIGVDNVPRRDLSEVGLIEIKLQIQEELRREIEVHLLAISSHLKAIEELLEK